MEEDIKRWIAKRKSALVLGLIQGKATIAERAPKRLFLNSIYDESEARLGYKISNN